MPPIKGHFDGTAVVLDERVTLAVGPAVQVGVVEARPLLAGFAAGMAELPFTPHADPTTAWMTGGPPDERDAIQIDPLDRVPDDFVRQFGSGRGEVHIADDFDDTPDEFNDYL